MRIIVLLFILLGHVAFAQQECIVSGEIKGVEDGTVFRLFQESGQLLEAVVGDTLKGGRLYFRVPLENREPKLMSLITQADGFPNGWLKVWVAAGKKVEITGEDKLLGCWRVKSAIKEQREDNRYQDVAFGLLQVKQQLRVEMAALRQSIRNKRVTTNEREKARAAFHKLDEKEDSISLLIIGKEIELMKRSSGGTVWLNKLEDLSQSYKFMKEKFPYREEVVALYIRLTKEQQETETGRNITVNLFPPRVVKVGESLADADLYDLAGKVHHLSDYLGKFILVDFWSMGCGPCRMALPEMRKVAEANRERLTVVSLNTDNEKNWREVSNEEQMCWENLNDLKGQNGLYARYGVSGIPHYVVISPEGKILYTWSGYGKGIIVCHLNRIMDRSERVMSVKQDGRNKVVEFPTVKAGGTEVLTIDKVVVSDTATAVYMKAYFRPHNWIMLAPESRLIADDGSRIELIGARGITLGRQLVMPDSGMAEFVLTFGPLPANAKSFDLVESDNKDAFKLLGVALER